MSNIENTAIRRGEISWFDPKTEKFPVDCPTCEKRTNYVMAFVEGVGMQWVCEICHRVSGS